MTGVPEPVFTGVGVALVTVFTDRGEVDPAATAAHAARLVDAGLRAVVVAGSTGEAAALAPAERVALVGAVRAALPGGVPVLAGTGAPSARQAVELTRQAAAAGADGFLVLSPPGSRDLPGYYRAVAEAAADRPVLAYHFPAVSAPGIPLAALSALPVRGLKDSSADPSRLLAEVTGYAGEVYVGSAALLALAGPLGATGAILALANLEPAACVAAFAGDAAAQRGLAETHRRVEADFPAALKRLLADRHGLSPVTRL